MATKEYLQILEKEIHSTVFATVDDNGLPQVHITLRDIKTTHFKIK